MKNPCVYVLILNWNGKEMTIDCVNSVLESEYTNYKVVVIDNGSTDGSVEAIQNRFRSQVIILRNSRNLGYAEGFNVGLDYAFKKQGADYCLVMNNDTIIDCSALSSMLKIAQIDDKIGFVTGKVYYYDRPTVFQSVGKREHPIRWSGGHIGKGEEDKGQYDVICERFFADDIFTLVSARLFKDIGGYNPIFFLQSEEYDWQARAKKYGYRIIYTPDAKIWHRESVSIGRDSAIKAYYDARNPMLVVLLHKSPDFFRGYFWLHLWQDIIVSSLRYIKHCRFSVALAKVKGMHAGLLWGMKNKRFTLRHFLAGVGSH